MMTDGTLTLAEWHLWHVWMQAQRVLGQHIERRLQNAVGISKAEFNVLVTLHRAPVQDMRVVDLAEALFWEKSRVAHQLTRMEGRGFLTRVEGGAQGRRTGIGLTQTGRLLAVQAIDVHAASIQQYFLADLSPDQSAAILAWSERMIQQSQGEKSSNTQSLRV